MRSFVTLRMTAGRKIKRESFRAQSRNPLGADKGNSVYGAPTARRSFVTLRMTAEGENKKSVILNEVKNLSLSTTDECRTSLEILRYTQDDIVNRKQKTNKLIT